MPKPHWLKTAPSQGEKARTVRAALSTGNLHTVCEEAHCPNKGECWSEGTATFLILGDVCTRACRFCTVTPGIPKELDNHEPANIARAAQDMKLNYVVLTSVGRDDLEDQGAEHFADCITALKKKGMRVEALIPDFNGDEQLLTMVIKTQPDVLGHNLETVKRLTPEARDRRASYEQSLAVLRLAKSLNSTILTKSSLLLGMGETKEEVIEAMQDLRDAGVDILTLGQYLQPSKWHFPVKRYLAPEEFNILRERALELGFSECASGPMVRSSYRAGELLKKAQDK